MTRPLLRIALGITLLIALLAAYFFWFRDSSLVAVDKVTVEGVPESTAEGQAIREALVTVGREMTTLHVEPERLLAAVSDYPEVADVEADAGFPDSLTVSVTVREPVARIGEGSDGAGVAADGVILPARSIGDRQLPLLPLDEVPRSGRVGGPVLDQVKVLGAAPPELLEVSASIARSDEHGPVVTLISGIELRFGDASRAKEKWVSAVAVLTDPDLQTLDYVDLSSSGRPATGGIGHSLPALP